MAVYEKWPTIKYAPFTVGKDDVGHDVKFYGATSGKYFLWDESEDTLVLAADVTLTGDVEHTGNQTYTGDVTIGESGAGGDLVLWGDTAGKYVQWQASVNGLYFVGGATLNVVSGTATSLGGALNVAGNIVCAGVGDFAGYVSTAGVLNAGGNIAGAGTLAITGGSTLGGAVSCNSTLTVVGVVNLSSDISMIGTTGTHDIILADGAADALSIRRAATNMILFDSSTPRITITPATTVTGAITSTGGLIVDDVTDAADTTTGSIQTDGGIACVLQAYIGTGITMPPAANYPVLTVGSTANATGSGVLIDDNDRAIYVCADDNSLSGSAAESVNLARFRMLLIDGPFQGEQYCLHGTVKYIGASLSSYGAGVLGTMEWATSVAVTGYHGGVMARVGGAGTTTVNDYLCGVISTLNQAGAISGAGKMVAYMVNEVSTQVWTHGLYIDDGAATTGIYMLGCTTALQAGADGDEGGDVYLYSATATVGPLFWDSTYNILKIGTTPTASAAGQIDGLGADLADGNAFEVNADTGGAALGGVYRAAIKGNVVHGTTQSGAASTIGVLGKLNTNTTAFGGGDHYGVRGHVNYWGSTTEAGANGNVGGLSAYIENEATTTIPSGSFLCGVCAYQVGAPTIQATGVNPAIWIRSNNAAANWGYGIYMATAAQKVLYAATTPTAAQNAVDIQVNDTATLDAGRGRALYLKYTANGTHTSAYKVRGAAIDMFTSAACPGVTGLDMYIGDIDDLTVGNVFGIAMYCEDIGNAASNFACIDLGRVMTNQAADRDTFMRFKGHGGRAKSIFYMEGTSSQLADQFIMLSASGESGSDWFDLTTDVAAAHTIVGALRVGKEAVIGGGVTTQYYIPLYTADA